MTAHYCWATGITRGGGGGRVGWGHISRCHKITINQHIQCSVLFLVAHDSNS